MLCIIQSDIHGRRMLQQQSAYIHGLTRERQEQAVEERRLCHLIWMIENFVETSRTGVFMESPLLKTSVHGYAVRLNVHFEGDQGQRLVFSLRVQIGEHDGALEWPFRPIIRIGIITVFDQPLEFELDFRDEDLGQIVGLQQPVSEENPNIDLVAMQTSDILERGCLVEGTLCIKCTIQS